MKKLNRKLVGIFANPRGSWDLYESESPHDNHNSADNETWFTGWAPAARSLIPRMKEWHYTLVCSANGLQELQEHAEKHGCKVMLTMPRGGEEAGHEICEEEPKLDREYIGDFIYPCGHVYKVFLSEDPQKNHRKGSSDEMYGFEVDTAALPRWSGVEVMVFTRDAFEAYKEFGESSGNYKFASTEKPLTNYLGWRNADFGDVPVESPISFGKSGEISYDPTKWEDDQQRVLRQLAESIRAAKDLHGTTATLLSLDLSKVYVQLEEGFSLTPERRVDVQWAVDRYRVSRSWAENGVSRSRSDM